MTVTSVRLASLPLLPRPIPVHRRKPVGRTAAGRMLCIDKDTVGRLAGENGVLPRIGDLPIKCPVLVVGTGVPAFKVQHVSAALKARGVRGYWLVEVEGRLRAKSGAVAETLVGFPGLRIERIGTPIDV